jgi:hypothetical protein
MNANGGGTGGPIIHPSGTQCPAPPYTNISIWMWDYEERTDAPLHSSKTWLILFDNRTGNKSGVKLGGSLSGYYGDPNFDEDKLTGHGHGTHSHDNLKIVVATKVS